MKYWKCLRLTVSVRPFSWGLSVCFSLVPFWGIFSLVPFWGIFSLVRSSDVFSPLSWISYIIQNHQYIFCSFIFSPLSWNHRSFMIINPFLFLYFAVCLPSGELSVHSVGIINRSKSPIHILFLYLQPIKLDS